jgi:hypothetical protein
MNSKSENNDNSFDKKLNLNSLDVSKINAAIEKDDDD